MGEILKNDKVVCSITGSYLSFIEFDGIRYWDIRENIKTNVKYFFIFYLIFLDIRYG
jgi:hypothetical protein